MYNERQFWTTAMGTEEMEVEGQRKEGGRELKQRGAREGQKR